MATRLEKHRRAKKEVERICGLNDIVFVVHYSCESFYDRPKGRSARITSIAIRNLATGQTRSFSIHKIAEAKKKTTQVTSTDYDELEKKMLKQFYEFVRTHKESYWLHWNMRDINFGFPALAHRYEVLGSKPFLINDERLFDLARILVSWFGTGYSAHPRLTSLIELNSITNLDFLSGAEEAAAFESGEYVKLHQSTLRKVDVIANIFGRLEDGTLRTSATPNDIYGGHFPRFKLFITTHWIVSFIGFFGAVAGLGALFFSLFNDK